MADFEALVDQLVTKENPQVHGFIAKGIDRNRGEFYSQVRGYDSLKPDAQPLTEDVVLKVGSATKLITSIALLQCIDRGQIGLDEPLTKTVLPEFDNAEILLDIKDGVPSSVVNKTPITARHLLSHTSGLGYFFTHRLLRMRTELFPRKPTLKVHERYLMPLVFEPGKGWLYGCSLDWAGMIVRRLNDNITLGDYFVKHIWVPLGLEAPYPRFNIDTHPEYSALAMGGARRTAEGLMPMDKWAFDNPEDSDGGAGLACRAQDYVAVLADLIAPTPKLLKPETVELMYTPQLEPNSASTKDLVSLRAAWDTVAGPVAEDQVSHGLGGLLCVGEVPEIKQPKGILAWGGASNIVWWACREKGVAGFFATQQSPFGNPTVTELVNAWKKNLWTKWEVESAAP